MNFLDGCRLRLGFRDDESGEARFHFQDADRNAYFQETGARGEEPDVTGLRLGSRVTNFGEEEAYNKLGGGEVLQVAGCLPGPDAVTEFFDQIERGLLAELLKLKQV